MPSAGESLSGERRVVTALFCDVVGSTSIAETMDPEDWSEMVGLAVSTMGDLISRYGGTVTEFAGLASSAWPSRSGFLWPTWSTRSTHFRASTAASGRQ